METNLEKAKRLIDYCCKQAIKYDFRVKMLLGQECIEFLYAIGSNSYARDRWLKRVKHIQDWIDK